MTQLGLFAGTAPLARRTDPASSHAAAHEVDASGQRDSQKARILTYLRSWPVPSTSTEITSLGSIDRYVVSRRLPDLERDGLVQRGAIRECSVTGRRCVTWRAV